MCGKGTEKVETLESGLHVNWKERMNVLLGLLVLSHGEGLHLCTARYGLSQDSLLLGLLHLELG